MTIVITKPFKVLKYLKTKHLWIFTIWKTKFVIQKRRTFLLLYLFYVYLTNGFPQDIFLVNVNSTQVKISQNPKRKHLVTTTLVVQVFINKKYRNRINLNNVIDAHYCKIQKIRILFVRFIYIYYMGRNITNLYVIVDYIYI